MKAGHLGTYIRRRRRRDWGNLSLLTSDLCQGTPRPWLIDCVFVMIAPCYMCHNRESGEHHESSCVKLIPRKLQHRLKVCCVLADAVAPGYNGSLYTGFQATPGGGSHKVLFPHNSTCYKGNSAYIILHWTRILCSMYIQGSVQGLLI